jgi:hypothetical protein
LAAIRERLHSLKLQTPACILSLDFKNAFDNIAHDYLFRVLEAYGFSDTLRNKLKGLYRDATSAVQINGHLSSPLDIHSSIRQEYPLSMVLFAISINPLLEMPEGKMLHARRGKRTPGPGLITYADDITIILYNSEEVQYVREALATYTAASDVCLKLQKSKTLALGSWDTSLDVLGVPYVTELPILWTRISTTIRKSERQTWNVVTGHIKTQAKDSYYTALTFDKRTEYRETRLLARVWYVAQVFPPPSDNVRQINTAIAWFLWTGNIFRAPLSTLYRERGSGGWGFDAC